MQTLQQTTNPHQATTLGNLLTPSQLQEINQTAERLNISASEQAELMFNCSLYELTKQAADSFLSFLANLLPNQSTAHTHEHDCAECGGTFECSQTLCNGSLARYCDDCTAEALGELCDDVEGRLDNPPDVDLMILCKPQPKSNGRLEGIEI